MDHVHARYNLIKHKALGQDELVDSILSTSEDNKPVQILYSRAKQIYTSPVKKNYVEACLLAERDLTKISDIVGVPIATLSIYRSIFFDVEGFDKLSLLELVDSVEDDSEKAMKLWALSQGLDFIAWRLGKQVNINPVEGLQEIFTLCVFKSKEAMFSGNAAESSKEATKWVKLSTDIARLLKMWVLDGSAARTEIELALASISPDFKSLADLDS